MSKKNITKSIFKIFGIVIGIIISLAILLVVILTITEYNPKPSETLEIKGIASKSISQGDSFSVLSWNLGYCALGENADFFYDGGKKVYGDAKPIVMKNISAIEKEIQNENCDIIFLQEVDVNSSRSHYVNELKNITSYFSNYNFSHATNYKVLFIPMPLPPMAKVNCGITTLSAYPVDSAARIALPCPFTYPTRICNLKRALLVNRIPIEGTDKELVLINLHLEAYDSGEGKIAQTKMLKELLEAETAKGNYVIAGGDFNQTFSNTDTTKYPLINESMWKPGIINIEDFSKNLIFLTDNKYPTCRSLDRIYFNANKDPNVFQYYMIDGFICSSNIQINSVETKNLNFVNSDHNPVKINVTLK